MNHNNRLCCRAESLILRGDSLIICYINTLMSRESGKTFRGLRLDPERQEKWRQAAEIAISRKKGSLPSADVLMQEDEVQKPAVIKPEPVADEAKEKPQEEVKTYPNKDGDGHFHRWQVDEPDGSHSTGTCRNCGLQKVFKNSS